VAFGAKAQLIGAVGGKMGAAWRLLSRVLPTERYCELKNRAVGVRLDESQFASVVFDHGKTDRESHSHTPGFRRKERIEYTLSILDRNSGPGVLDREHYRRVTVEPRCETQTSCFRCYGAHCIDSVFDEVQEHLLELRVIQMHFGKVVLKLGNDGHFVDLKIVLQQS
jgi:hypothetical protein